MLMVITCLLWGYPQYISLFRLDRQLNQGSRVCTIQKRNRNHLLCSLRNVVPLTIRSSKPRRIDKETTFPLCIL